MFDAVNRSNLWNVLGTLGCPENFKSVIRLFHDGNTGRVSTVEKVIDSFPVCHIFINVCMLAALLFTLCLAVGLETMNHSLYYISTRIDGTWFNLNQPKPHGSLEKCVSESCYLLMTPYLVQQSRWYPRYNQLCCSYHSVWVEDKILCLEQSTLETTHSKTDVRINDESGTCT